MTVEKCQGLAAVRGYTYVGLQAYSFCFGGTNISEYKDVSTGCDLPCSGNNSQICGGGCINSIYAVSPVSGEMRGQHQIGFASPVCDVVVMAAHHWQAHPHAAKVAHAHPQSVPPFHSYETW